MAAKQQTNVTRLEKPKVRRPGIHAKTRFSKIKTSKHYKKLSRGQG